MNVTNIANIYKMV